MCCLAGGENGTSDDARAARCLASMAACSDPDALFVYTYPNGSHIAQGILAVDNATCIYAQANCTPGGLSTTTSSCCEANSKLQSGTQMAIQIGGPWALLYGLILMIHVGTKRARRRAIVLMDEHAAATEAAVQRGEPPPPQSAELEEIHIQARVDEERRIKNRCTLTKAFEQVGYIGALAAGVCQPLIMQQSIQNNLNPAHRAAVLAAHAFLIPMEEVFCFLEDTMTVRINFAMGSGDLPLIRSLFKAGVCFGLGMGALAAAVATCLTFSPTVFKAIIYPDGETTDSIIKGCSLLLSADDVAQTARAFFLLSAWQWPFVFINKVLAGVAIGGGMLWLYGWPMMVRGVVTLLVWFVGLASFPDMDRMTLLGAAYFLGPPLSTAFFIGSIARATEMRTKYGLTLAGVAAAPTVARGAAEAGGGTASDGGGGVDCAFFVSSFKAMVIDLCQQASISVGIYVAAAHGIQASYQVAAMQSALPAYGNAWCLGLALAIKAQGPQFIASGARKMFPLFAGFVTIFGLGIALLVGVLSVMPFGALIASTYGVSACGYASTEDCAPLYAAIFEGPGGLPASFSGVFSAAAALNCLYLLLKPLLYACMDIDFMMRASLASILVCFVSAILVGVYALGGSPAAIFLSMYAPHILLIPVFAARLLYNCRRIWRGEPGPWTAYSTSHSKAENFRASRSGQTTPLAAAAITG